MKRYGLIVLFIVSILVVAPTVSAAERIVSLNGDITEIIYALGEEERLVAVDASSVYPAEANDLPNVGYQGQLSVETILTYEPTMVIANEDAGPAEVLDQLRAAAIDVHIIYAEHTLNTPVDNIRAVASLLDVQAQGEQLAQEVEQKIADAAQYGESTDEPLRVLFLYLGSAQMQFAGGKDAPSNAMITGVGAIDAGAEAGFVGFMPFTPEAVVQAAPDVLIVTERGIDTLGSVEAVLQIPGIAQTPAAEKQQVIVFEDLYFIGMGPRTGDALLELAELLTDMQ